MEALNAFDGYTAKNPLLSYSLCGSLHIYASVFMKTVLICTIVSCCVLNLNLEN